MWQISELMVAWQSYMEEQQQWQPRRYEDYFAAPIDTTPFWRPKLQGLKSKYYHSGAEKALPAIIIGLVARIGEVRGKRIALPQAMVRVHPKDPVKPHSKKNYSKRLSVFSDRWTSCWPTLVFASRYAMKRMSCAICYD
jgi:hypothetical protein